MKLAYFALPPNLEDVADDKEVENKNYEELFEYGLNNDEINDNGEYDDYGDSDASSYE